MAIEQAGAEGALPSADGNEQVVGGTEQAGLGTAVLTVSDTRTLETDRSGGLLCELIVGSGHRIIDRRIVADDIDVIQAAIRSWIGDGRVQVMLITGGTGITARDVTPEAIAPFVTKDIPGFGELFRWLSYAEIGAATIQSRAQAALCGDTLLFALPGSPGAVRLAMEKIVLPQLDASTRPCNFAQLLPRIGARGSAGT